ncbi:cytochrome c [Paracoccaceae bacterium Fryx2]|nr:cytochrome c [Paracoccaceae bacterium Fryx2]
MRRISGLVVAAGLLAGQTAAQDADKGRDLYLRHCASCHGEAGQGNGPMAPTLTLQPPDLTALTERNNGVFPTVRVVMRIDGREPLVAHGSPMPVYGPFFEGIFAAMKAPDGMPIITSQPVVDLVAWLESVQK